MDLPILQIYNIIIERAQARGLLNCITQDEIQEFKSFFWSEPEERAPLQCPYLTYIKAVEMGKMATEDGKDDNGFFVVTIYRKKAPRPLFGVAFPSFSQNPTKREIPYKREWLEIATKVWRNFFYPGN